MKSVGDDIAFHGNISTSGDVVEFINHQAKAQTTPATLVVERVNLPVYMEATDSGQENESHWQLMTRQTLMHKIDQEMKRRLNNTPGLWELQRCSEVAGNVVV